MNNEIDAMMAKKILGMKRALIRDEYDEVFHILYSIADPTFTRMHEIWEWIGVVAENKIPDNDCKHHASFQWADKRFACAQCGKDMP